MTAIQTAENNGKLKRESDIKWSGMMTCFKIFEPYNHPSSRNQIHVFID